MLPRLVPLVCIAVAAAMFSVACSDRGTSEEQVREVIAAGEEAAESRDLSGLMDLVSDSFEGGAGQGRDKLRDYLRGYFVTHQSVHLLTRIESVEFPYDDMARVSLTVGALGREVPQGAGLEFAADVHEVELQLENHDGHWLVTRAEWR